MMPPIAIIGAVITIVSIMMSICCTCVVSLVVRVMSDAALKRVELMNREVLGAREDRPRRIRPNPVATFAEK